MTEAGPTEGVSRGRRPALTPLLVVLGVLAVVAALVGGAALGSLFGRWDAPGDDSPEAGFARDMSVHHGQAVQMSLIMISKTDDEIILPLARDIATTQAHQQGQMFAWLRMWDLSQVPPGEQMQWMTGHSEHSEHSEHSDHEGHGSMLLEDGRMPGMASDEQIEQLRQAEGEEAEILYLQLMTTHHIAGVEMAQAGFDLSSQEQVLLLAETMIRGQKVEIDLMVNLLDDRGATVDDEAAAWIEGYGDEPAGDPDDHQH